MSIFAQIGLKTKWKTANLHMFNRLVQSCVESSTTLFIKKKVLWESVTHGPDVTQSSGRTPEEDGADLASTGSNHKQGGHCQARDTVVSEHLALLPRGDAVTVFTYHKLQCRVPMASFN